MGLLAGEKCGKRHSIPIYRNMPKRFRIGILLSLLILVLAAFLVVNYTQMKDIIISTTVALVGLLWAVLRYIQKEEELKIKHLTLSQQERERMDKTIDSTIGNIMQAHQEHNKLNKFNHIDSAEATKEIKMDNEWKDIRK